MPVNPNALLWAQQPENQNRPEAQQILAKDWAMNNPDRPEAKALLQKYAAATGTPTGTQNGHPELFSKMNPTQQRTFQGILDGSIGPGVLASQSALQPIAGVVKKGGDILMQKAIGATKYIPGFGEKLAQQGLVGTRNAMVGQVDQGLEESGEKISQLASGIPNNISQDPVSNAVGKLSMRYITPEGYTRPEDIRVVNQVLSKAQDYASADALSGEEMAARRMQAGRAAREAGAYKSQPSQQLKARIAKAEQSGYSDALKKAYAESFPNQPNALAEADSTYSTLAKAKDILSRPPSIGSVSSLASQMVPTSLIESSLGRGMIGAGNLLGSSFTAGATNNTLSALRKLLSDQQQPKEGE